MRTICHRAVVGIRAARSMRARISLTPSDSPSVATSWTSAWVPAITVRHTWQASQPWRGHCSAAAKARAATDRPEPGGPVNSQAWVIEPRPPSSGPASVEKCTRAACSTADRSSATASGCPTTWVHTLTPR